MMFLIERSGCKLQLLKEYNQIVLYFPDSACFLSWVFTAAKRKLNLVLFVHYFNFHLLFCFVLFF